MEKCAAFWRHISKSNLKPVNCSLQKPKKQEQTAKQTEALSPDGSINSSIPKINKDINFTDFDRISWCQLLKKLQKRGLDKVAVREQTDIIYL